MEQINNYVTNYEKLKNILDSYNSYNDKEQFFLFLGETMKITPEILFSLYNNFKNLERFTDEDENAITLINKIRIIINEYRLFYEKYFSCNPYKSILFDNEKLFSMFDLIDNYMNGKNNFNLLIYNIIKNNNILYDDLKEYAEYMNGYCYEYDSNKIVDFRMKSVYNFKKMYDLYRKILRDSNFLVKAIKNSNEKFISFVYYADRANHITPSNLSKTLSKFTDDSDVNGFISKYDRYYNKCKQEEYDKLKKEKLNTACGIIRNYLDGNYDNLQDYCSKIGTTVSTFKKYVNLMNDINNPIYEEYVQYDENKEKTNFEFMHNCISVLLDGIRNGVQENGSVREFNLLDYYSCTHKPFKDLKKFTSKYFSSCDVLNLTLFTSKYEKDKILDEEAIDKIFNTKDYLFCKFDENGKIIDPGYELNSDDKRQIFNLLNEKSIPFTTFTYSLMREKYIQNEILEKYNKNTIKR